MPTWGIKVSEEMDEAIKAVAEERGATISNLVRQAVAEYLTKQGKPVKAKVKTWGGHKKNATVPTTSLPYDDDPAWNDSIARSLPALQRLADKAIEDYKAGRTTELDPDELP